MFADGQGGQGCDRGGGQVEGDKGMQISPWWTKVLLS